MPFPPGDHRRGKRTTDWYVNRLKEIDAAVTGGEPLASCLERLAVKPDQYDKWRAKHGWLLEDDPPPPASSSEDKLWAATRPTTLEELLVCFTAEELERWAGLLEHPAATRARLRVTKVWEQHAEKFFMSERRRYRQIQSVKDAEAAAWLAVQRVYQPPDGTEPIPDVRALRAARNAMTKSAAAKAAKVIEAKEFEPNLSDQTKKRLNSQDFTVSDPSLDAKFVYEHLYDEDAMDKVPSRGAANLLVMARKDPADFMGKIWPPHAKELIRRNKEGGRGSGPGTEERAQQHEIDTMIRQAVRSSARVATDPA